MFEQPEMLLTESSKINYAISQNDDCFTLSINNGNVEENVTITINSDIAECISNNYLQFVNSLDKIIEGNTQCVNCCSWISKKETLCEKSIKCHEKCSSESGDKILLAKWFENISVQCSVILIKILDSLNKYIRETMLKKNNKIVRTRKWDKNEQDGKRKIVDENDFVIYSDYGKIIIFVDSTLELTEYNDILNAYDEMSR